MSVNTWTAKPPSPPRLPPHLEPESDIPGFEDVGAAIVFDRVPLGGKQLPCAGFDLGEDAPHLGEIGGRGDRRISGSFQHLRELPLQGLDRPANGIPVGY